MSKGDPVNVLVRVDPEGTIIKRKSAKVVDVLRKAAVLDIEGETQQRTVRFAELELLPEPEPPPPAKPKVEKKRHLQPVPDPAPPRAEKPESKAESTKPPPSIDEWASQGLALQQQLIKQAHEVENQMKASLAEAEDLELLALRKRDEAKQQEEALEAIRERIVLFDQLSKFKG